MVASSPSCHAASDAAVGLISVGGRGRIAAHLRSSGSAAAAAAGAAAAGAPVSLQGRGDRKGAPKPRAAAAAGLPRSCAADCGLAVPLRRLPLRTGRGQRGAPLTPCDASRSVRPAHAPSCPCLRPRRELASVATAVGCAAPAAAPATAPSSGRRGGGVLCLSWLPWALAGAAGLGGSRPPTWAPAVLWLRSSRRPSPPPRRRRRGLDRWRGWLAV
jgi:hypothetical protein